MIEKYRSEGKQRELRNGLKEGESEGGSGRVKMK